MFYLCLCIRVYMHVCIYSRGSQKMALGHIELELWMVVNKLIAVLGNELGSSTRALNKCSSQLNHLFNLHPEHTDYLMMRKGE